MPLSKFTTFLSPESRHYLCFSQPFQTRHLSRRSLFCTSMLYRAIDGSALVLAPLLEVTGVEGVAQAYHFSQLRFWSYIGRIMGSQSSTSRYFPNLRQAVETLQLVLEFHRQRHRCYCSRCSPNLRVAVETHQQEPENHQQAPETPHQEPGTHQQAPETPHQEPGTHQQAPETPHQEPETHQQALEIPRLGHRRHYSQSLTSRYSPSLQVEART